MRTIKQAYHDLFWKFYCKALHRLEWSGRWGRFIPLRLDDNGEWFVGIGVEYWEQKWWAGPMVNFMNRHMPGCTYWTVGDFRITRFS